MLGAIGFGVVSDKFGRLNGILLSGILSFIGNLSLYWVDNEWAYTFIRLACGAFAHGGVICCYVYIQEFMGPKWRSWIACQYLSLFSLGFMSLSLIGYYARDWHLMQVVIACLALPILAFHFLLPTSHRWLYSKEQTEKGRQELQKFAQGWDEKTH